MVYELVDARDVFDDDNGGRIYGINWMDDDNENIAECEWFFTEEERQEAIDRAYADQDDFSPEQ
jgi:hypothetical protein